MPHTPHNLQHCGRALLRTLLSPRATRSAAADPAARVGRIARIGGPAFLSHAACSGVEAAIRNWPLTSGDLLSTGVAGSVEVEVGSTLVQLDADSVLALVRVDDQQLALRLRAGSLTIRCRSPEMARQVAIECGDQRFELCDAGLYRLAASSDSVAGTAWQGALRCSVGGRSRLIVAGQSVRLGGDGEHDEALPVDGGGLALWTPACDTPSGTTEDRGYVAAELTGSGDLALHGDWYETAAYGAVWFPRDLPAEWAPYRYGQWIWLAPWGWTWIGAEPWAFAPFHYGRWACFRGAWGWLPGCRRQQPVYAPALVAWSDPVEAGRPPCGSQPATDWLPLGPQQTYVPPYRCSERYLQQLNAPHDGDGSHLDDSGRQLLARLWARLGEAQRSSGGTARA